MPIAPPMAKSIYFLEEGKNLIVYDVITTYLFIVEWVGIYKGK